MHVGEKHDGAKHDGAKHNPSTMPGVMAGMTEGGAGGGSAVDKPHAGAGGGSHPLERDPLMGVQRDGTSSPAVSAADEGSTEESPWSHKAISTNRYNSNYSNQYDVKERHREHDQRRTVAQPQKEEKETAETPPNWMPAEYRGQWRGPGWYGGSYYGRYDPGCLNPYNGWWFPDSYTGYYGWGYYNTSPAAIDGQVSGIDLCCCSCGDGTSGCEGCDCCKGCDCAGGCTACEGDAAVVLVPLLCLAVIAVILAFDSAIFIPYIQPCLSGLGVFQGWGCCACPSIVGANSHNGSLEIGNDDEGYSHLDDMIYTGNNNFQKDVKFGYGEAGYGEVACNRWVMEALCTPIGDDPQYFARAYSDYVNIMGLGAFFYWIVMFIWAQKYIVIGENPNNWNSLRRFGTIYQVFWGYHFRAYIIVSLVVLFGSWWLRANTFKNYRGMWIWQQGKQL